MDYKEKLVNMLGLAADCDDDAIENACAKHVEDVNSQMANAEDYKNRLAEAEKLTTAMKATEQKRLEEQVDRDLVDYAGVISDKDAVKAQLLSNRDATIKFLRGIKKPAVPNQPLHNREKAGTPAPITGSDSEAEKEAAKLSNRAKQIQSEQHVTFPVAWRRAKSEFDSQKLIGAAA